MIIANSTTEIISVIKNPLYRAPIIEDFGVDIETNCEPIIEAMMLDPANSNG